MAEWKGIEGYRNPYRISTDRQVERMNKRCEWIRMNINIDPRGLERVVLYATDGKPVTKYINRLMYEAFGEEYRHIPQVKTRPVEMIDRDGNVIDTYHSMVEAAEDNYMAVQTVRRHCQGRIKTPFAYYDYTFRYKE